MTEPEPVVVEDEEVAEGESAAEEASEDAADEDVPAAEVL
jgi:hypothetical protein